MSGFVLGFVSGALLTVGAAFLIGKPDAEKWRRYASYRAESGQVVLDEV